MKKFLSITLMILALVFMLASCDTLKGMIIKRTVSFDLNGGEAGEDYAESVKIGDGKTLALTSPTREGYNFLGWYSGETEITESTPITSDITLKAEWEIKSFKVSFLDYYGNTVSTQTVNFGESATAPTVESIINKQRFDGWSADFSKVVEDITINALYVDNTYTITYDLGEKGESFTEPCFYGETPKIPAAPEIDGYVFSGWYLDEELTERYFFDYKLDRDITLYAKFYDTSLGEYIVISNVDQLMAIGEQPDAKYLLTCDINCKGEQLTPIGEFSGEIDGNGYKIHNFSISDSEYKSGLIRQNKGTIQNLSLSDFIFVISTTKTSTCYYGIISGINNGSISNCHILDSKLKIYFTSTKYIMSLLIGSISGQNHGMIIDCTNKSTIEVFETQIDNGNPLTQTIGGIVGANEPAGILQGCSNYGEIANHNYFDQFLNGSAPTYILGGIIGRNSGTAKNNINTENVFLEVEIEKDNSKHPYVYMGGAIGLNDGDGSVYNSYCTGTVTEKSSTAEVLLGGFVALNNGNIYNCYTTSNIVSDSTVITTVGGFAAENKFVSNYPATINKCFSTGSITLGAIPTDSGYFVGKTTGTEQDCYYLDRMSITIITETEITDGEATETVETIEPVTPTCTVGEAKTIDELTSVDFIENTLYFDRMIWLVVEGQLPTLR